MGNEPAAPVEPREEREAAEALAKKDPAALVRRLLRAESQAVLSTLSARHPGWPFASLAPYALSRRGEPILLLAGIAQHTRNLRADDRACLFVQDSGAGEDPQAGARVTVIGRVRPVPPPEEADARARYLARHPEAASYFATHDFGLWLHGVEELRYIGGFGVIGWVPGAAVLADPERDPLAGSAQAICRHMNDDHADALALYCRAFKGRRAGDGARMVGVDADGFDVEVPGAGGALERLRFEFRTPVSTPAEVRAALVSLVGEARERLARQAALATT